MPGEGIGDESVERRLLLLLPASARAALKPPRLRLLPCSSTAGGARGLLDVFCGLLAPAVEEAARLTELEKERRARMRGDDQGDAAPARDPNRRRTDDDLEDDFDFAVERTLLTICLTVGLRVDPFESLLSDGDSTELEAECMGRS